jgi:hypothetical protein
MEFASIFSSFMPGFKITQTTIEQEEVVISAKIVAQREGPLRFSSANPSAEGCFDNGCYSTYYRRALVVVLSGGRQ